MYYYLDIELSNPEYSKNSFPPKQSLRKCICHQVSSQMTKYVGICIPTFEKETYLFSKHQGYKLDKKLPLRSWPVF